MGRRRLDQSSQSLAGTTSGYRANCKSPCHPTDHRRGKRQSQRQCCCRAQFRNPQTVTHEAITSSEKEKKNIKIFRRPVSDLRRPRPKPQPLGTKYPWASSVVYTSPHFAPASIEAVWVSAPSLVRFICRRCSSLLRHGLRSTRRKACARRL